MAVIGRHALMIHAPGILRVCISVVSCLAAIFIRKEFLNLPGVGLNSDGKLEIFFRNVVPELDRGACQRYCRVQCSGRNIEIHTLYTIMTAKRLQNVAKKRPSM